MTPQKQRELDERWVRENACGERGCMNYAERGFIYCTGHMRGFDQKIPEHYHAVKMKLEKSTT